MAKLYLDSNIVIRLVEGETPEFEALSARLAALADAGSPYVVSDLVYMECLVKPLALGDLGLQGAYEAYLDALDCATLRRPVWVRAAAIRGEHRFGTPDSLHLAAAIEAGCDTFVTGDQDLCDFPDIHVSLVTLGSAETEQE